MKGRNRFSVISTMTLMALVWATSVAQTQSKTVFDLPAQPLADSLRAVGSQTNTNLLFDPPLVAGKRAPTLKAEVTVDEALTRLLVGTGIKHEFLNETTIVLAKADAAGSKSSKEGTGLGTASGEPGNDFPKEGQKSADSFRVAQLDQASAGPQVEEKKDEPKKNEALTEIVVTGTHIRGATVVGSSTSTYSHADILDSGRTTVGEFLQTIPENFNGGQNPNVVGASGSQNAANVGYVSGPNLRGLGNDSTLNVINGHRMAVSGYLDASDISMLPVAVIDRIEVLKDSASAQYGSDAVGGVVNYILKNTYDGVAVSASINDPTRGGGFEQRYDALAGTHWSSGNVLLNYEFSLQDHLLSSDRDFSQAAGVPANTLAPAIKQHSALLVLNERPTDSIGLFLQGIYGHKMGEDVGSSPAFNFASDNSQSQTSYALAGGIDLALPGQWRAELTGTNAKTSIRGESNSFIISPFELQPFSAQTFENSLSSAEVVVDGPIVSMPSGDIKAAVGGGYRKETFETAAEIDGTLIPSSGLTGNRNIKYAYLELNVPIVGRGAPLPFVRSLTFSLSGRYEDYSDVGASSVPQLGVSYVPIEDLTFRGSWGKAFRAPTFEEMAIGQYAQLFPIPDPRSATGNSLVLDLFGSNPTLKPQTAKSWTSGFDLRIPWLESVTINATYFNIDYSQRITAPIADVTTSLTNPANSAFVVRNPSAALLNGVLTEVGPANFFNESGLPYDPSTVGALVYDQNQNITSQKARGADVSIQYEQDAFGGHIHAIAANSWLTLTQKLTAQSADQDLSGTIFNAPRKKLRGGVAWSRGGLGINMFGTYISSEADNSQIPNLHVSSWTTFDGQLSYAVKNLPTGIAEMRVSLSVQNMFDRNPPFLSPTSTQPNGIGFDSTNANAFGRLIAIQAAAFW